MAYTTPNTGIIRPWTKSKRRYVHRKMKLTVGGSGKGGGSTGTASDTVDIPGPGRLVAIRYGAPAAIGVAGAALTGGSITLKAETTAGAQIWTDADISSVPTLPLAIGTTSLDEGAAATAATDGFSGGFPIRGGVFGAVAAGTDTEVLDVDMTFRLCTYVKLDLVAQSGADGSGVVTRYVDLGGPGVLAAIAVDYQNEPATTDILIKADQTSGMTLHSRANTLTDLAPTLLGAPGADEAINASAATDGTECGLAFQRGLFIDVAQADAFTSSNERIILEMWIDD